MNYNRLKNVNKEFDKILVDLTNETDFSDFEEKYLNKLLIIQAKYDYYTDDENIDDFVKNEKVNFINELFHDNYEKYYINIHYRYICDQMYHNKNFTTIDAIKHLLDFIEKQNEHFHTIIKTL